MSKLSRCRVLLAKVETTYNVDANPTGADDAVQVEELAWAMEGLNMVERPLLKCTLGEQQQIYGGSLMSVTFMAEIKGSGTEGVAPDVGAVLRGCGLAEDIVVDTSVAYQPASLAQESLTIYLYEDGTLIKVTGCKGDIAWTGEVGGRMMAEFTFQGHFSGPTDVAVDAPTYDSTVPAVLIGGNFSIGGFGPVIQALSFNLGQTVETPQDWNSPDGYSDVNITDRDVNGSINPEQTLVADNDFMAEFKSGALLALDTGLIGTVAGNRFQMTAPAVYYRNITPGDRNGIQIYDLPFGAAETAGDDEFSLVFT